MFLIQALSKVGVKEVVIAINYQAHHIINELKEFETKYNIKITYSQETEALGTAGPLKLAENILREGNTEGKFFVFNSDVICDYPLKELIEFHSKHGEQGSITLATVQDPSRFGVVVSNQAGKVESFVEKPSHFISNKINAGIYLLNLSVLDRIPQKFCMIEREIFPQMATENKLYSLPLSNDFWFDIGKPQDYIIGQGAYLKYYNHKSPNTEGFCLVDPSSTVESGCKIGPNVVIGPNCKIGSGCRLSNCTLVGKTTVGNGTLINNSIISWKCKLGNWVRVEGLTAIAEEVEIKDEVRITECMILSHKAVGTTSQK